MTKTHSLHSNFQNGASGGFVWTGYIALSAVLRSGAWLAPVATIVAIGMLVVFYQVVRGAVQQGELKRKANAVVTEANWRCNTAKDLRTRDNCRGQLIAAATGEADMRSLDTSSNLTLQTGK